MADIFIWLAGAVAILLILAVLIGLAFASFYRKVPQGYALVVSGAKKVDVTFTGQMVLPVIHKAETMDISVKTIEIDRRQTEGLICQDNIRADIKVNFFVRVNKAKEDVIKVAQAIGCDRASNIGTLEELFAAKFSEALKTVGKQMDFISLYTERANFRDRIIEVIGTDLNGYSLEDVAIDYLEQTPLSALDSNNILDAQGIRKITELTAIEHVATNNARNDERKQLTAKNVETKEAVLELERQQADAEARQRREVQTVIAREEATTAAVRAEERLRSEMAGLEVDQKLGIEKENLEREIAVAAKNRERVLAVESERVRKAAELEDMSRKVETLAAEKDLEAEMAGIADLRRSRVAVEKTVAVQEEEIASLRVVEEANRQKDAAVILAEGEAQASLVKDIKAAEAAEAAAEFRAGEQIRMAKAELESSQLESQAKIRMAEGVQAESAAAGLAEVEVLEAQAAANEKLGLAQVNVDLARAGAVREMGEAEASKLRDSGMAEAEITEAKLKGEAKGLTDKAAAMRELEGVGQEHEEFVRRLEADTKVRLAEVDATIGVATAQAEAMKAGLESANIDIVGGSDMFVDKLVGAITTGKSIDGMTQKSDTLSKILEPYQNGDEDLVAKLTEAIAGLGADGIRDLSLADLLSQLKK